MQKRKDSFESIPTASRNKPSFTATAGRIPLEPSAVAWGTLPSRPSLSTRSETRRRGPATLTLNAAEVKVGGRVVIADPVAGDFERAFAQTAAESWTYESRLLPAGSLGPLASVWWTRYQASGGLTPAVVASLSTFDVRSGQRLLLDRLLGEALFTVVLGKVRQVLEASSHAALFAHAPAALSAWVRESFRPDLPAGALVIAVPAASRAGFGTVAEVRVHGPPVAALHPEK